MCKKRKGQMITVLWWYWIKWKTFHFMLLAKGKYCVHNFQFIYNRAENVTVSVPNRRPNCVHNQIAFNWTRNSDANLCGNVIRRAMGNLYKSLQVFCLWKISAFSQPHLATINLAYTKWKVSVYKDFHDYMACVCRVCEKG